MIIICKCIYCSSIEHFKSYRFYDDVNTNNNDPSPERAIEKTKVFEKYNSLYLYKLQFHIILSLVLQIMQVGSTISD